jgi:ADP-glucose pyrophosphorylase
MSVISYYTTSISVGEDSVMEYCIVEKGAKIGRNCIVSNLHVPTNALIPDGSYLHTVPIQVDGTTHFATFAFGNNSCWYITGS